MWCGVLWLTACLVTATNSQVSTTDHITVNSAEASYTDITENPIDLAISNHYDELLGYTSTTKRSVSRRDVIRVVQAGVISLTEKPNENSRSRQSQSHESTGNKYSESKSPENISQASDETKPSPESSAERGSADISANNKSPGNTSGETEASAAGAHVQVLVESNERVEQTTNGPVKGHKWKDTDIYAFIDIPYGTIDTPFEAPRTAQSWNGTVHDVEEHNSSCPQYQNGYVGDLNCLTLSIFVPAKVENASVLFYVHDSRFHSGDPMIYGPEHLVSKGVIFVLPNYRIGALGFLCLQDETVPGNAGLKDLTKALEWTKDNIEQFGGNPSNIVVGGDGDAGALVGYLALCSSSKSYINKVITESGSMLSHLAIDRDPKYTAATLAKNIQDNSSDKMIYNNIFAEVSVQQIVEAAKGMRFNPCIERNKEPFINASPWMLLQNKEFDITFMIGSASHAGTHEAVAKTDFYIEQMNADYELILPEDLNFKSNETRRKYALRIKEQYFGNGTITRSQMTQLSLLSTDASYLGPLIRSARLLVDAGATVYLYEFKFVGDLNRELISLDKPVDGAVRSDIIGYLFTQEGHIPDEDSPEKHMISLMVDLWVSFINNGTPTAENINWETFKAGQDSEEEFLQISSEPEEVKGVHEARLRLWTELYDEYFIERSFARAPTPGYCVLITIIFWITNTKLDY